jgi:hypothetical protein
MRKSSARRKSCSAEAGTFGNAARSPISTLVPAGSPKGTAVTLTVPKKKINHIAAQSKRASAKTGFAIFCILPFFLAGNILRKEIL